jgi:uncharacterized protein YdaU (DUF1376 family)
MDAEQRGWYWQLLVEAWNSEDTCYLPNDPDLIWRLAGASNREHFESKSKLVLEQFKVKRGGHKIYNVRQFVERSRVEHKCKENAENGKKGAKTRWNRDLQDSQAIAVAMKSHGHSQNQNQRQSQNHKPPCLNPTLSQEVEAAAVSYSESEIQPAAAAFREIGFDQPFGQSSFQTVWYSQYSTAKSAGEWLTSAMEKTIQECQRENIRIPPQFYDAKRSVEKFEQSEFERSHPKRPPM